MVITQQMPDSAARQPLLRWGVVSLLLISQLATTPGFVELTWHMKGLVGHYLEHSQDDQSLTFAGFLRLHYGDLEQAHQEEHDHSGLPFKDHHPENLVVHSLQFPPIDAPVWPEPLKENGFAPLQAQLAELHSVEPNVEIWQPPRTI
jgi:hypothetical protein